MSVETLDSAGARLGVPLVLLFDIDGTLCELMPTPDLVRMPDETQTLLRQFTTIPGVTVAFVTGRSVADARRIVCLENVTIYGNHGSEIGMPGGTIHVDDVARAGASSVHDAVRALELGVHDLDGVWVENKRYSLSVHYRAADDDIMNRLRARVRGVAERFGLRMTEGNCVLELRSPGAANKGDAVLSLVRETSLAAATPVSVVFAGDDLTDEDAFRALRAYSPAVVTINVGGRVRESAAEFQVPNPGALRAWLTRLADRLSPSRASNTDAGETNG